MHPHRPHAVTRSARRAVLAVLRFVVAAAVLIPILLSPASRAEALPPPTDFYGLNFVTPFEPRLPIALETGARSMRWQFSWRDHEIAPGEWIWTPSDMPMAVWRGAGLKVHAILHNPPDFWRRNPAQHVPRNFDLPWDHPDNGWGRWCYLFASRYKDTVASYEIWNEPDLNEYWESTPQEYYKLLRTCYQAIRAADPDVAISMAGMAWNAKPWFFPAVLAEAKKDPSAPAHNFYFDAASVHAYHDPEEVYDLTLKMRAALARYGFADKPIWVTEVGTPVRGYGVVPDTPGWDRVTEEEQAWYMIQTAANAHAAGVKRLMIYRFADDYADHAYGLVRVNHTKRPSFYAFSHAVNVMRDIVAAKREIVGNDLVIIDLRRADGVRIVVFYTRSGRAREARIPAERGGGTLINAAGEYAPIAPVDGFYTVTLPEAPGRNFARPNDYSVGGPVLTIVE